LRNGFHQMFGITCTWQITTRRNIVKRASEAQQKSDRKSEIACACRRSELAEKSSPPEFIGHADSSKCRCRCHDISDIAARTVSCIGRENKKKKRIKFRILLSYLRFFISCVFLCSSHDTYRGEKGEKKKGIDLLSGTIF